VETCAARQPHSKKEEQTSQTKRHQRWAVINRSPRWGRLVEGDGSRDLTHAAHVHVLALALALGGIWKWCGISDSGRTHLVETEALEGRSL